MAKKPKLDSGPFVGAQFSTLIYWIQERERIRLNKESGRPGPWTDDPVLQKYRFCNVHREDDLETRWIAKHWRTPAAKDPHLWFAMCVARLLNKHATLHFICETVFQQKGKGRMQAQFVPVRFAHDLKMLRATDTIFNGAYIVSTNGHSMDKVDYITERVLVPLWEKRERVRPVKGDTLASFANRLREFDGMGSFMSAQVVADLKNTKGQPLAMAADWWDWATSGPGSRRGMHRLLGQDHDKAFNEAAWAEYMAVLRPLVVAATGLELHAQDVQNCLCEFDKYQRVRNGEGEPKQLYRPSGVRV